jgi:hypothetical protein
MKCSPLFSHASLICFSATAATITLATVQPASLAAALSDGQTERDAQLLVAGNYPDKQFSCTEQDLDDIIATFDKFHALGDNPPIKVEHVSSPLDPLGHVTKLWRTGSVLMGKIAFDPLVAPLLAKRAVKALSVGLGRLAADNSLALSEVSIVLNPHVKSAALLSDDPAAAQIAELSAKLARLDADAKIMELKRQGKLFPAVEMHARRLLECGGATLITLSDGNTQSVSDAAFALLSALPASVKFSETATGKNGGDAEEQSGLLGSDSDMTAETKDFLTRKLGVDPAKVAATMAADKAKKGGA